MDKEQDLWIIPLLCSDCGGKLAAGSGSVIFPCTACGILWEPDGEALVRRELHTLSGDGNCHLPFWIFPFHANAGGEEFGTLAGYRGLTGNIKPLEPERAHKPPLVFVPAAAGMATHLMVRAGRLLTVCSPALCRTEGFPAGLAVIGVRERDAALMAPTIVLATLSEERRRTLSFLQAFSVTTGTGRLCAIPFERQGEQFRHAGWSLEL